MTQPGRLSIRLGATPALRWGGVARPATGQVVERTARDGRTFAIRFRAYDERHYLTLGHDRDGWTRARAEVELANVLADVRRGLWQLPERAPEVQAVAAPTFHEFASEWMTRRRPELAAKTIANYEWALTHHLLPFFAEHQLSAITVEEVDRYKAAKLREARIGPNQVNTTLTRLAQVLEDAVEYGHLERNQLAVGAGGSRARSRTAHGSNPSSFRRYLMLRVVGIARSWLPWPEPDCARARRSRSSGGTSASRPAR